jgi:hypothetical protein
MGISSGPSLFSDNIEQQYGATLHKKMGGLMK